MNIMDYEMTNKVLRSLLLAIVTVLFSGHLIAQNFQDIDQLILLEKYDKAESKLKALQAEDPRNEDIDYRLGKIEFLRGNYSKARQLFTEGIKHASRKPINYIGLGAVAVKEKNFELAKGKLDKALEVDKAKSPKTMLKMAEAYLGWEGKVTEGAKFLKEAEALLLQVTGKDPENPAGYVQLGNLYFLKGVDELAKTYYQKAIEMDDKYILGHYRLGTILKKEESYTEAASEFQKSLEIDPKYGPALISMAEMYYGIKQYDKGLEYMNKYLQVMGEDDLNAIKRKGIFLYLGEKYTDAIEVFESVKGRVEDPVVLRLLAYSYVKMEEPNADKALENFDQYFKEVDKKWYIAKDFQTKGAALGLKGDREGMVAEYEKAINLLDEKGESTDDLLLDLSNRFKEQKDYLNQAKYLSQYLERQERFNLKETFNLGRAYYFAEDWANGDSTYTKMIKYKEDLYLGYLWRGRIRDKQDEKSTNGLALEDYNKVYELLNTEENRAKYTRDFLEACRYLGAYHTLISKEYKTAIPFWQHILESKPEDPGALEGLKFCESQG